VSAFEAIASARSMRWFTSDPVDRALVEKLIWAGTRASSPNNTQPWYFVVVREPSVKRELRDAMIRESAGMAGPIPESPNLERAIPDDPVQRRTALGAKNLLESLHRIPVLIFICATNTCPSAAEPQIEYAYSAMFAAAQNMLVAARALGLGAAFTTLHEKAEGTVRQLMRIPGGDLIGVTMPVGWPGRPFGPVTRRPLPDVIRWGHA
jgi:nitroreductase